MLTYKSLTTLSFSFLYKLANIELKPSLVFMKIFSLNTSRVGDH